MQTVRRVVAVGAVALLLATTPAGARSGADPDQPQINNGPCSCSYCVWAWVPCLWQWIMDSTDP